MQIADCIIYFWPRWNTKRAGACLRPARLVTTQRLVADSKFLNELPVSLDVRTSQIIQEALALADHLQQPAAAVMILGVRTKMLVVQNVDPLRQQRHLDARRSGVVLVCPVLGDRRCFFKSHCVYSPRVQLRLSAQLVGAQYFTGPAHLCKGSA